MSSAALTGVIDNKAKQLTPITNTINLVHFIVCASLFWVCLLPEPTVRVVYYLFIAPISLRYFSAPGWKGTGTPFVASSGVKSFAEVWML